VAYNTRVEQFEKIFNEYGEEEGWTLIVKGVIRLENIHHALDG
jgi:hypothetical protein